MRYFIVSNEESEEYLWLMEHGETEDYEDDERGFIEAWSLATNTKSELKHEDIVEITKEEYEYILNRETESGLYLVDEREELLEKYS